MKPQTPTKNENVYTININFNCGNNLMEIPAVKDILGLLNNCQFSLNGKPIFEDTKKEDNQNAKRQEEEK